MQLPLVIFGMLNEITTEKFMNDMLNIPNECHTFRYITIDCSHYRYRKLSKSQKGKNSGWH